MTHVDSFSLNPLHWHCGPLNTVSAVRPSNWIDAACWDHDKAYQEFYDKYGYWPYKVWIEADDIFVETLRNRHDEEFWETGAKEFYLQTFTIKKASMPNFWDMVRLMDPYMGPEGEPQVRRSVKRKATDRETNPPLKAIKSREDDDDGIDRNRYRDLPENNRNNNRQPGSNGNRNRRVIRKKVTLDLGAKYASRFHSTKVRYAKKGSLRFTKKRNKAFKNIRFFKAKKEGKWF